MVAPVLIPDERHAVMSPEEFVRTLYRICLGRDVEPAGLTHWTEVIRSTADPTGVLSAILESDEYKAQASVRDDRPTGTGKTRVSGELASSNSGLINARLSATPPLGPISNWERLEMTASCRDTDQIPKYPGAGGVFPGSEGLLQRMHNGLHVVAGAYHGEWMAELIRRLGGHHEPQEELLFHSVLPLLKRGDSAPVMLELGSFWAYYSLWFRSVHPEGRNILVEPDPHSLEVGKRNFELNGFSGEFFHAAIGIHNGNGFSV